MVGAALRCSAAIAAVGTHNRHWLLFLLCLPLIVVVVIVRVLVDSIIVLPSLLLVLQQGEDGRVGAGGCVVRPQPHVESSSRGWRAARLRVAQQLNDRNPERASRRGRLAGLGSTPPAR
jgi:hypothetical protein